jgi:hypothetical protein
MLQTALTLARSLGKDGSGGNAALGLWLGEKYENSLRRKGEKDQADKLVKLFVRLFLSLFHRSPIHSIMSLDPFPSPSVRFSKLTPRPRSFFVSFVLSFFSLSLLFARPATRAIERTSD